MVLMLQRGCKIEPWDCQHSFTIMHKCTVSNVVCTSAD